jgi:hypothetical protein
LPTNVSPLTHIAISRRNVRLGARYTGIAVKTTELDFHWKTSLEYLPGKSRRKQVKIVGGFFLLCHLIGEA